MNKLIGMTVGLGLGLCTVTSSQAALLMVDYNVGTGPTQSGWTGVTVPTSGSYNTNFFNELGGAATATLGHVSADASRNRGNGNPPASGSFTLNSLYQDFAMSNAGSQAANWLDLSFSGLTPNTQYEVTFYGYDNNNKSVGFDFTDTTGGGSVAIGSIVGNGLAPTSNTSNTLTVTRTSDGSGLLSFHEVSQTNIQTELNGFQIAWIVPEPATLGLLALGGLMMVHRGRR